MKYIEEWEAEGNQIEDVSWLAFRQFLEDLQADRNTRALAAATQLSSLEQGATETVADFVDRYTNILAEMPTPMDEPTKIITLAAKFRKEIRIALAGHPSATSFREMLDTARRIEYIQKAEGMSSYQAPRHGNAPPTQQSSTTTNWKGSSNTPAAPNRPPPNHSTLTYYDYGKVGHIQRNCPDRNRAAETQGPRCYTCEEIGHIAPHCPRATCTRCGQVGHTASRCTNRPAPAEPVATNPNADPLGKAREVAATRS